MAKSNINLEATILLMFDQKRQLEERIRELEERSKYLEEKTRQATEVLLNVVSEFDDLQNMILLGRANASPATENLAPLPQATNMKKACAGHDHTSYLRPGRIDMTGTAEEDRALKEGWWPSEGSFRWAGKDKKDPMIQFSVCPGRDYELAAKIFIPDSLAGKQIKILANDALVADFSSEKGAEVEKKIMIPKDLVTHDILKVVFRSDFWKPGEVDPTLNDDRTLSLAFEYISLE